MSRASYFWWQLQKWEGLDDATPFVSMHAVSEVRMFSVEITRPSAVEQSEENAQTTTKMGGLLRKMNVMWKVASAFPKVCLHTFAWT